MEDNHTPAIRLVAMDMDGTLLNDRKELPEDFIPWVHRHPEVRKVIASGRQYYQLLIDLAPLGDELIYLAENGGLVFENGEQIYCNELAVEDQRTCLQTAAAAEQELGGIHITPILCGAQSAYMEAGAPEIARQNAGLYYAHLAFVEKLEDYIGRDCMVKIALFIPDQKAEAAWPALHALPEQLKAVVSGDSWIDVANASEDKGLALQAICARHGIDRSECMAFGDYMNDAGLLRSCDESYCMENGLDELKKLARYIAPSNNEQGVMQVLKARIGE